MAAPMFEQPYSVQLDPQSARNLATHGATILLLDVPECTPIGLDQQVFLSGPRFKGVKMLPPGPHFLSYQARARDGALAPPVSTLLDLQPQQVLVRRWDPASEGLVELEEEETGRYAAGVARFDFDRELAPYDLNRYGQWVSLSNHITQAVLKQLLPADGEISIMSEAVDPALMTPSSAAEKRLQQQLEEGRARREAAMQVDAAPAEQQQQALQPHAEGPQHQQQHHHHHHHQQQGNSGHGQPSSNVRGGRCRYSQLPRVIKVPGMTAAELTAANVDKTRLLEQVMARYITASSSSSSGSSGNGRASVQQQQQQQGQGQAGAGGQQQQQQEQPPGVGIIGELQFAFIAFVFGQSLEGYMQWKQLLVLLLGCVTGPLERHTSLFVAFLAAVTAQLRFGLSIPSGSGGSGSNGSRPPGPPGSNAAGPEAGPGSEESGPGIDAGVALLGAGLVEELLPDSFLRQAFRGFFEMVQESAAEVPAPLLAQARVLESVLAAGLGWDFSMSELHLDSDSEDEGDEYGPVVVDLTEQQLAELEAQGQ